MKILKDKTAIITGATRGIGRGIAETFAKQGANVLFTYSSSTDLAKEIEKELSVEGVVVRGYKSDASSFEDCQKLVEKITKEFHVIDILINNAGITRDNIMLRMQEVEWNNVIDVHLNGQYLLIKSFIKKMVKNKWGRIINISSTSAVLGNKGQANYAAAKAGIEAMSRSLARELGSKNINVNCVAPGFIETDMTKEISKGNEDFLASQIPLGRLGKPIEIAEVVNFLASDQANYITGQTIHVNGGLYM